VNRVTHLLIYPFKSAAGIAVPSAEVDAVGLKEDRRWMAVDREGAFLSQRTHPRMALLGATLHDDSLELSAEGMEPVRLARGDAVTEGYEELEVWFSHRYAVDCGAQAAEWMSDFLGQRCRVVRSVRPPGVELLNAEGRVRASFADASPALVISEASLADLNGRLQEPVSMDRFRPNVVVDGFGAFAEDAWGAAFIGGVPTRGGRPCPRCATTLVDQQTGERGVEPLRTLNTYRANAEGLVDFGVNIYFQREGVLRVGDPITGSAGDERPTS
jgi:uncharacterized protein YcbX